MMLIARPDVVRKEERIERMDEVELWREDRGDQPGE
jgi:hypothetical protein